MRFDVEMLRRNSELETKRVEVKNMKAMYRVGAALLCFSWGAASVIGQQTADAAPAARMPASSSAASRAAEEQALLLDVVVTDKSGKPVAGLQQKDFTVLDDHRPTEILSFKAHDAEGLAPGAVDASTDVILILDEVNAPYDRVVDARQWIQKFLRQNNGQLKHPVTLAILSDNGLQVQSQPAVDGDAMADALEKQGQAFRTVETGTLFGGSERLRISQDALGQLIAREKTRPGRKMVIWVGPGWPLLSGPSIVLTSGEEQQIFRSAVRFSAGLREARITLYNIDTLGAVGVGTARTSYYENFVKGLTTPSDAILGDISLQVMDVQSGGRAIFGSQTVESSLDRCVEDLDAFYTLSIPAAVSERPDAYHELEVKVGRAGLKARTRTGYYAQP